MSVARKAAGVGQQVIQGAAFLTGLVEQIALENDSRLEVCVFLQQWFESVQGLLWLPGYFQQERNAVFQFRGVGVAVRHLIIKGEQFLLLLWRQIGCHSGKAVEVSITALIHDPFHVMDGGLEVVSLYGLDRRNPVGLEIIRVDVQPQLGELFLGVIAVQGLGDSHRPLDHHLVSGLFGSLQVVNQGNVVASALGCNFGR